MDEPSYFVFRCPSYGWVTAEDLLLTDFVGMSDGSWLSAADCPEFAHLFFTPPAPATTPREPLLLAIGKVALGVTAIAAVGVLTYKIGQAIGDEDFGTVEFPAWFRKELIAKHIAAHGSFCFGCSNRVPRRSLAVDHIVAIRNGGRTSRANAQVLCTQCNSRKGAKNSPLDYVRGRAA